MKNKIMILAGIIIFFVLLCPGLQSETGAAGEAGTGPEIVKPEIEPLLLQPSVSEAAPAPESAEPSSEEKAVSERIAPGNITIDFKDADIKTVLRVLSEKSGVNIVASKDVDGMITIRLN
ncbi:MAG: hypothetical protein Q8R48_01655, partial [Candidatus Omnitrophota bacterium]|nr:hypothetical protein [Candidatus Omnitrophota bacterium]